MERPSLRVALPVWENRISPVFDVAHIILVVDLVGSRVVSRAQEMIAAGAPEARAQFLANRGINVLICGAVSDQLSDLIESAGIRVVPFLTGDSEEVLASYARGIPPGPALMMPGCRRWQRRMGPGRGRGGWVSGAGPGGRWARGGPGRGCGRGGRRFRGGGNRQ